MSFSSSSSSGSERKKDVVVVVVSDLLKDEGGFDDDPVVARLPRLDDFWTRLLLLDISKLKVLFPRHHRLAVASPSSSSPVLSPSVRAKNAKNIENINKKCIDIIILIILIIPTAGYLHPKSSPNRKC